MKKLPVVLLVVGFLVMWSGCGGGSKKTLLPEKTVQPEATRTTVVSPPVAKATSGKGEQTVDVAGKTCLPAGTYKVTSKDLTEAVVNTVCKAADHYVDGTLEFVSLQLIQQQENEGVRVKLKVSFRNCDDCPRDFIDATSFSKNPLGEWQLPSGDRVELEETEESRYAKLAYNQKIAEQKNREALSRVTMTLLSDKVSHVRELLSIELSLRVEFPTGVKLHFRLLGQLDDGRIVEFGSASLRAVDTWTLTANDFQFAGYQGSTRIIAYKLTVGSGDGVGGVETDWIYFNQ